MPAIARMARSYSSNPLPILFASKLAPTKSQTPETPAPRALHKFLTSFYNFDPAEQRRLTSSSNNPVASVPEPRPLIDWR